MRVKQWQQLQRPNDVMRAVLQLASQVVDSGVRKYRACAHGFVLSGRISPPQGAAQPTPTQAVA